MQIHTIVLVTVGLFVSAFGQRGDMGFIDEDDGILDIPNDRLDEEWRSDTPSWETGTGPVVGASTYQLPPVQYPTNIRPNNFGNQYGYTRHFGKACKVIKGYGKSSSYHQIYQHFGPHYDQTYEGKHLPMMSDSVDHFAFQNYPLYNTDASLNMQQSSMIQAASYPVGESFNTYPVPQGLSVSSVEQGYQYPSMATFDTNPVYPPFSGSSSAQQYPSFSGSSSAQQYPPFTGPSSAQQYQTFPVSSSINSNQATTSSTGLQNFPSNSGSPSINLNNRYPQTYINGPQLNTISAGFNVASEQYLQSSPVFANSKTSDTGAQPVMTFPGSDNSYQQN